MCSIVVSYTKNVLQHLIQLNAYRGTEKYAAFVHGDMFQGSSMMPETLQCDKFTVVHHQAPTHPRSESQPAQIGENFLFHNGIIKQRGLKKIADEIGIDSEWDTKILCAIASNRRWDLLSDVDGTFACIARIDYEWFVFRNDLAPMFVDVHLNMSSTKFDGSIAIPANKVFKLDGFQLAEVATFTTFDSVYYIPNEE